MFQEPQRPPREGVRLAVGLLLVLVVLGWLITVNGGRTRAPVRTSETGLTQTSGERAVRKIPGRRAGPGGCYEVHFEAHPLHPKDPPGCYATEEEARRAGDKAIQDAVDEQLRPAFDALEQAGRR